MGSHVTRHEHNHVYEKEPSTDTSTGFHIFELHISTVKYGVTTILVLLFLLAVAYFLWRRCRRNVQRRQWRRMFEVPSFRPQALFGYRQPPLSGMYPGGPVAQAPPATNSLVVRPPRYSAPGPIPQPGPLGVVGHHHMDVADHNAVTGANTELVPMDKLPLPPM